MKKIKSNLTGMNSQQPVTAHKNLAEAFLSLAERMGENTAKRDGNFELYQKSKLIPGFVEAKESWRIASVEWMRQRQFGQCGPDALWDPANIETVSELFFFQLRCHPSGALQGNKNLIAHKAEKGDLQFFTRISSEIRKTKRRATLDNLQWDILAYWLPRLLWLMSDKWGSFMLEKYTGRPVSEENFVKCRQRLKLVSYELRNPSPIITGFNKKTGQFVFRNGWTNLDPKLSI